ncbi:hypothetical protein [Gordonia paraffinivorans]|nr:hypothetical protein [Gordonia paraffinivorans]
MGSPAWTSRLSDDETREFVGEVISRHQGVIGEPALFRFSQMRAMLTKH